MKFLACVALWLTADAQVQAPVYVQDGDNAFKRQGAFHYQPINHLTVLFCIGKAGSVYLQCVVRNDKDRLLIIETIATEPST
jgi:hypothetical protein